MIDMYHRIFVYSAEQKKEKDSIASNMGQKYIPGSLIVKGQKKLFTDIVLDISKFRYSDARVVAEGDIRRIPHTAPRNEV